MSILSDRHLNKVAPAAQKDKVKMKRVVIFTDEDNQGIRGANVTKSNLTDYAVENTVRRKVGTGYDTGKTKHIIKVPKSEYKKENPMFRDKKAAEGYFIPTTPRDTKRLTKYNRRVGARFVSEEKAADKIDKKIDKIENAAKRGNPFSKVVG